MCPCMLLRSFHLLLAAWHSCQIAATLGQKLFVLLAVEGRLFYLPFCGLGTVATCHAPTNIQVCIYFIVGISIAFFTLICALCSWKLRQHKKLPFRVVQIGTLYFRLQVRVNSLSCHHTCIVACNCNRLLA